MRLRVISCCLVVTMLIVGFVCCHHAMADVVTYDVMELYKNETKFTQFIDENGKDLRIVYVNNVQTGKLHVQLLVDGEISFGYDFEVGSEWYNKSYFYVSSIESGPLRGRVELRMWNGVTWIKSSVARIRDGEEGEITILSAETEEFIKGKVIITIPAFDGFKDTTPVQSISFIYGVPLPTSGSPDDISISIEGGVSGSGEVISHSGYIRDGYYFGHAKVIRELNPGVNMIIVKVTSNGVTYSAKREIERIMGQVDEDGDGIDDRTGLPIWPEYPDYGDSNTPQPPEEGATIIDYIKYLTDSVLYAMKHLVTMLKGFMGGLAQLTQVFSQFFAFMPAQFSAIIILGLIMAVILRVLGR